MAGGVWGWAWGVRRGWSQYTQRNGDKDADENRKVFTYFLLLTAASFWQHFTMGMQVEIPIVTQAHIFIYIMYKNTHILYRLIYLYMVYINIYKASFSSHFRFLRLGSAFCRALGFRFCCCLDPSMFPTCPSPILRQ